ncbi:MAG TPA: hypothetical protein P5543_07640 [Planctomycetota bacterium]|nr:hypothetical protein [Planctomycetota bacterium]
MLWGGNIALGIEFALGSGILLWGGEVEFALGSGILLWGVEVALGRQYCSGEGICSGEWKLNLLWGGNLLWGVKVGSCSGREYVGANLL